jgi:hypothetical protein
VRRAPLEVRFWEKVDRRGPDECWPWLGITRNGYGRIYDAGRHARATEVALRLSGVIVPGGMLVCHRCDNPLCVNPAHLFVGTDRDNSDDKIAKGRYRNGSTQGTAHHEAKLTDADVLAIRRRHNNRKGTRAALAVEFGVHPETITNVANSRTWRHLPLKQELCA